MMAAGGRTTRTRLAAAITLLLLAACAQQERVAAPPSPPTPPFGAPAVAPSLPPEPAAPAAVEAYKSLVAGEIWRRNAEVYTGAVPDMLKSIVVVEMSIDRAGNPIGLAVYRSNGFRQLEARALESVVRAAPFPPPPDGALDAAGYVTFLETFLFRADGRFQLRSLVLPALAAGR